MAHADDVCSQLFFVLSLYLRSNIFIVYTCHNRTYIHLFMVHSSFVLFLMFCVIFFLFTKHRDMATEWPDEDTAAKILQNAVSVDLEALKLGDWSEMKSDAAIARWVFSGVAAHATTKLPGRGETDSKTKAKILYLSDWSWMVRSYLLTTIKYFNVNLTYFTVSWIHFFSFFCVVQVDLETRDGFESYGATAYFDSKYKLTQIYYAAEKRNVTSKQVRVNVVISFFFFLTKKIKFDMFQKKYFFLFSRLSTGSMPSGCSSARPSLA